MRFILKWSYICADFLTKQLSENHEKRGVYYFGFQVLIGSFIKGISLLAVSLALGTVVPTLVIVFIFASFRMLAGGYHMDTYGKCLAVSMGLFVLTGLITQYTWQYWNLIAILLFISAIFLAGIYVVYRWAPKDTPNKPITKPEEIRKFKKLSFIYVFLFFAVMLVLWYFKLKMIVIAAAMGLGLELFTITPVGHRFFDMVKGKITVKKKRYVRRHVREKNHGQ